MSGPFGLPLGPLQRAEDFLVRAAAAIGRPKTNTYRLVAKSDGLHVIKWDGSDVGPLGAGGGSLSSLDAALAADLTMTSANTFYDATSVALTGAGTWVLYGKVQFKTVSASGGQFIARLYDGTTVLDEAGSDDAKAEIASMGSGWSWQGVVFATLVTLATPTIKLQGASTSASQKMSADPTSNSAAIKKATRLIAVKIA